MRVTAPTTSSTTPTSDRTIAGSTSGARAAGRRFAAAVALAVFAGRRAAT
jgi:hypothetical protein